MSYSPPCLACIALVILTAFVSAPDTGDTVTAQGADPVEALLRRLPARFPELSLADPRRTENTIMGLYSPQPPGEPDSRPPWILMVHIESFDTDAETEAGLQRSMIRPMGPTRRDTVGGIVRYWWADRQVLARIGRHIVEVSTMRPAGEPLVPRVFESVVPGLRAIARSRPQRPWAIGTPDVITFFPPAPIRDAAGAEYQHGGAHRGVAYDLNGDGTDDYLFQGTMCGTGGCPYAIFDGASGRRLGDVFGYPLIVRAQSTNGLPNIDIYSHGSATSGTYTSHVFDGTTYVVRTVRKLEGQAVHDLFASFADIPRFRPGR